MIVIIFEAINWLFWWICRFFYWLITARDCKHCQWGGCNGGWTGCWKTEEKQEACMKSICRVGFERKKDGE